MCMLKWIHENSRVFVKNKVSASYQINQAYREKALEEYDLRKPFEKGKKTCDYIGS